MGSSEKCFAQLFAVNPQEPQITPKGKSLRKKMSGPLGTQMVQRFRAGRASQVLLAEHWKPAPVPNFYGKVVWLTGKVSVSEHKRRGLRRLAYPASPHSQGVYRGFVGFTQYLAIKEHQSVTGAPQQCCSKKKKVHFSAMLEGMSWCTFLTPPLVSPERVVKLGD